MIDAIRRLLAHGIADQLKRPLASLRGLLEQGGGKDFRAAASPVSHLPRQQQIKAFSESRFFAPGFTRSDATFPASFSCFALGSSGLQVLFIRHVCRMQQSTKKAHPEQISSALDFINTLRCYQPAMIPTWAGSGFP